MQPIGKLSMVHLDLLRVQVPLLMPLQSFYHYWTEPIFFYDFWLRDSCSATDLSDWAGPFSASTSCGIAAAPYLEDFEMALWEVLIMVKVTTLVLL